MAEQSYPNGVHLQPGTIRYEVRIGSRGTEYDSEDEALVRCVGLRLTSGMVDCM
jgi:hypothetical protein